MANLQSYQTLLVVGKLYRIVKAATLRPVGKAWVTLQGIGTIDLYIAEDGAPPGLAPADLDDMGKTRTNFNESFVFDDSIPNFISIQQNSGTNIVYISGVEVVELDSIS